MNGMVDYKCESCGYRFDSFFHNKEDAPDTQSCPHIVEYTYPEGHSGESSGPCLGVARKYISVPGEYRATNAQRFEPIVIWQHNSDPDRFSFPGRNDETVDEGYHAIVIRDGHTADKWTKHINEVYSREKQMDVERDRHIFSERLKEARADRAAKVRGNPRLEALNRAMIERQDRKRSNRYDHGRQDVHFHIQALEFNQSNRQDWCDKDTGWKAKRG